MKVKLNFQVDKPTLNNRLYSKIIVEKALYSAFKAQEGVIITSDIQEKIIGYARSYKIRRDGIVIFECDFVSHHRSLYQNLISTNIGFVTINAKAKISEPSNIIDELQILNLFITQDATTGVMNAQTDDPDINKKSILNAKPIELPQDKKNVSPDKPTIPNNTIEKETFTGE